MSNISRPPNQLVVAIKIRQIGIQQFYKIQVNDVWASRAMNLSNGDRCISDFFNLLASKFSNTLEPKALFNLIEECNRHVLQYFKVPASSEYRDCLTRHLVSYYNKYNSFDRGNLQEVASMLELPYKYSDDLTVQGKTLFEHMCLRRETKKMLEHGVNYGVATKAFHDSFVGIDMAKTEELFDKYHKSQVDSLSNLTARAIGITSVPTGTRRKKLLLLL